MRITQQYIVGIDPGTKTGMCIYYRSEKRICLLTSGPEIDIDTGIITNWIKGVTADVHFKVCDSGSYYVKDAEGNVVLSREDEYVPNCLIPGKYGDYIIMTIDENGKIAEWNPSLDDFMNE